MIASAPETTFLFFTLSTSSWALHALGASVGAVFSGVFGGLAEVSKA